MTTSLITRKRGSVPTHQYRLYGMHGGKRPMAPIWYERKDTGEEFSHIAGSIAWPSHDQDGYAIIIGATREDEPRFRCLQEATNADLDGLLSTCLTMRERWGYGKCEKLLRVWWGDADRFVQALVAFNKQHQDGKRTNSRLVIAPPIDWDKQNFFEIGVRALEGTLRAKKDGVPKRLEIGDCDILRGQLAEMPRSVSKKTSQKESWPAVEALGYAVHSMLVAKPWRYAYIDVNAKAKTLEDLAAEEGKKAMRVVTKDTILK